MPSTPATTPAHHADTTLPRWAAVGGAWAALALILEFGGSLWGDSPDTSWPKFLAPIAWPTALRVMSWLAAAVGALAWQAGIARTGAKPRWVLAGLTAALFVTFALGVATDQQWATWH